MIPNEIIDQILDKTDIIEVISGYISLKKAGQNFKARCPFHEEKTGSFVVSPAKQIYHCFGCGAGGNAIGFLMRHEKMPFLEAIQILAEKTGVSLPRNSGAGSVKDSLAEKLYAVNDAACNFYEENLTKACGKGAYRYFIERGINTATIKRFRLGFAEEAWDGLIKHCSTKSIDAETLSGAGLILQKEGKTSWYDRFRNRIIFPIFDQRNRILGFGGRALGDVMPKYVNSPETHIYSKGRRLYGLNFSREFIRKQGYAIIVEGYFDLIMPFQNEIKNIVATLGTALTTEQIRALRRITKNVIMIYDSDKAGEGATLRSLDLLIEEDMNVRVAILPKGADPDSFVRKEGKAGLREALKNSKDLFDYKLGTLTAKFKKSEPRGKARIVEEMLPTLNRIKNAVLKEGYLKKMSEELSVDESSVRMELAKVKPASNVPPGRGPGYFVEAGAKKAPPAGLAEMTLLAIALEDASSIEKIEKGLGLPGFKNTSVGKIFKEMGELHKKGKKIIPSHLISYLEDSSAEAVISEATSLGQIIQDKDRVMEDCLRHLRKDNLKEALHNMQFKIREAENSADSGMITKLIVEYNDLVKRGV